MYKPKNYTLQELAHPQIIKYFRNRFGLTAGNKHVWRRLDADCLRDLQFIRDEWAKKHNSGIYVNRLNIRLDSRGLRPPDDKDGSFYSTHKQGNTFDLEPVNGKNEELYDFIFKLIGSRYGKLIKLNTLENFEDTLTWVHVGYMNTSKKPLIIYL